MFRRASGSGFGLAAGWRRLLGVLLAVVGLGLLAGLIYFSVWLPRRWSGMLVSQPEALALPVSLDELAGQYPQIADLLRDAELDRVYKDLLLAFEQDGLDEVERLARTRGLLTEADEVRMTLVVDDPANVPAVVEAVRKQDVEVGLTHGAEVQIGIPMDRIRETAGREKRIDGIFVDLTALDHVVRLKLPPSFRPVRSLLREGEGVSHVGADEWHKSGRLGQGIKVGVLDLGFEGHEDLRGEELPEQLRYEYFGQARQQPRPEAVHGTACAEIVYEMAPQAELFLAGYDGTLTALSAAAAWLKEQGVQVISHSAGSSLAPMDGTGTQASLVDDMASSGILWVNAAGNEAENHYQAVFTDADGDGWHEFPDGDEAMALALGESSQVSLRWDDWQAVDQDLDLVILDEEGNILAEAGNVQSGQPGQEPVEFVIYTAARMVYGAVRATKTTRSPVFHLFLDEGEMEWLVADQSLSSPSDARGALAVAAVEWSGDTVADYSSRGPTGDGRLKPDIGGPTNVRSKSYERFGARFQGTSAAAPHVAGAAALVWADHPEYGPDDVRAFLWDHAEDLAPSGPDTQSGAGMLRLPVPAAGPPGPPPAVTPPTVAPGVTPPTVSPAVTPPTVAPGVTPPTVSPAVTPPTVAPGVTPPTALPGATLDLTPTASPTATGTAIATTMPEPTKSATDEGQSFGLGDLWLGFLGGLLAAGGMALVLRGGGSTTRLPEPPVWPELEPGPPPVQPRPGPGPTVTAVGVLELAGGPSFLVAEGVSILGRDPATCQFVLPDPKVSRRHLEVQCQAGQVWVTDLNSLGGTWVNGQRVNRQVLQPGDRLRVGQTEMVWYQPGAGGAQGLGPGPSGAAALRHPQGALALREPGALIGRDPSCDLVLDDPEVSRQHARVLGHGGQWQISDLNSRNGTFVNGQRVSNQRLHGGERIRVGQTELLFEAPRSPY